MKKEEFYDKMIRQAKVNISSGAHMTPKYIDEIFGFVGVLDGRIIAKRSDVDRFLKEFHNMGNYLLDRLKKTGSWEKSGVIKYLYEMRDKEAMKTYIAHYYFMVFESIRSGGAADSIDTIAADAGVYETYSRLEINDDPLIGRIEDKIYMLMAVDDIQNAMKEIKPALMNNVRKSFLLSNDKMYKEKGIIETLTRNW